jgi:hypothetical protein
MLKDILQKMNFKIRRKKDFKIIFCLVLMAFALNSCEAYLHYRGNVYNNKNEPVENAKISLIIGRIDTIQKMGEKFDTISIEQRKALRKKGVKDNFRYTYDGISEPVILYTDKNGYFKTKTIFFGCGFKCPDFKLLVEKDNLKKIFPVKDFIKKDSLSSLLVKEPEKLSLSL